MPVNKGYLLRGPRRFRPWSRSVGILVRRVELFVDRHASLQGHARAIERGCIGAGGYARSVDPLSMCKTLSVCWDLSAHSEEAMVWYTADAIQHSPHG